MYLHRNIIRFIKIIKAKSLNKKKLNQNIKNQFLIETST